MLNKIIKLVPKKFVKIQSFQEIIYLVKSKLLSIKIIMKIKLIYLMITSEE